MDHEAPHTVSISCDSDSQPIHFGVQEAQKVQVDATEHVKTDDDAASPEASDATRGAMRTKPFQHLQFLVRDWSNFDADWDEEVDSSASKSKPNAPNEEDQELDELVMVGRQKEDSKAVGDGKDAVYSRLRAEMKTYMRDVIKDRGLEDLQSTREQISRCFGTVDCFLLPHPGLAVTKKNFSGSIPQIGSFFRGMVNR